MERFLLVVEWNTVGDDDALDGGFFEAFDGPAAQDAVRCGDVDRPAFRRGRAENSDAARARSRKGRNE